MKSQTRAPVAWKLRTAIISHHHRQQLPYIILQTFLGSREPSRALMQLPGWSENSQSSLSLLSRLQSHSVKSEQPRCRNNITNGLFFLLHVMTFNTICCHLGNGIAFHFGSKWSHLLFIIHTCRWPIWRLLPHTQGNVCLTNPDPASHYYKFVSSWCYIIDDAVISDLWGSSFLWNILLVCSGKQVHSPRSSGWDLTPPAKGRISFIYTSGTLSADAVCVK